VLYTLLQKLPGYTRATLEAEDAELVDEWLLILAQEAGVQKELTREVNKKG
jgi:hypothetical protein